MCFSEQNRHMEKYNFKWNIGEMNIPFNIINFQ